MNCKELEREVFMKASLNITSISTEPMNFEDSRSLESYLGLVYFKYDFPEDSYITIERKLNTCEVVGKILWRDGGGKIANDFHCGSIWMHSSNVMSYLGSFRYIQ